MAYDLLLAEGYIRGETRKGYFVNEVEPSIFQKENDVVYAEKTESTQPVLIDFRAGAVDQKHFPLKTWRKLYNQVLTSEKSFLYGEPFGERDLREQIAAYLLESRGVKTDADSIIISGHAADADISQPDSERGFFGNDR